MVTPAAVDELEASLALLQGPRSASADAASEFSRLIGDVFAIEPFLNARVLEVNYRPLESTEQGIEDVHRLLQDGRHVPLKLENEWGDARWVFLLPGTYE